MSKKRPTERVERNQEIYALRKAGAYYREIAEKYGISIVRVTQILEAQAAKEAAGDIIHEMHD